jgi:hypothetical protein
MLLVCAIAVAVWEVCAWRSQRSYRPFQLSARDFEGFVPGGAWSWRPVAVSAEPAEPNILGYVARKSGDEAAQAPVSVRLVHGYNMPDCMRIKQYKVELTEDRVAWEAAESSANLRGRQVWRLTSDAGKVSVWLTTLMRADTFAETGGDVRNMAFPRVGIPDDAGWVPQGLRLSSFRHPVKNFRLYLRSRWNSSRCDLLTFLRLKQAAGADDTTVVLVAAQDVEGDGGEAAARARVMEAAQIFRASLAGWRSRGHVSK